MTRNSRTLKIRLIHKLKETQKNTLQVIEIINSIEKLERTIRYFNTQTTVDICERITNVITLPSQINSLF